MHHVKVWSRLRGKPKHDKSIAPKLNAPKTNVGAFGGVLKGEAKMDWLKYAFIGFMTCAALVAAVIVLCCCVANADFDAMIEREKEFEEWKIQHRD